MKFARFTVLGSAVITAKYAVYHESWRERCLYSLYHIKWWMLAEVERRISYFGRTAVSEIEPETDCMQNESKLTTQIVLAIAQTKHQTCDIDKTNSTIGW